MNLQPTNSGNPLTLACWRQYSNHVGCRVGLLQGQRVRGAFTSRCILQLFRETSFPKPVAIRQHQPTNICSHENPKNLKLPGLAKREHLFYTSRPLLVISGGVRFQRDQLSKRLSGSNGGVLKRRWSHIAGEEAQSIICSSIRVHLC